MKKKSLALLLTAAMAAAVLAGCGSKPAAAPAAEEKKEEVKEEAPAAEEAEEEAVDISGVTLTLTIGNNDLTPGVEAALDNFTEKTGCKFDITIKPGGTEGDNMMKTMMASGELDDIMQYNSGSLLRALNPSEHFLDLTTVPELADVLDKLDAGYVATVNEGDSIFGIPYNTCQGGAVMYNKAVYEELGLSVPETWADFIDNCKACQEAGYTPIISTCGTGSTWTSQVPFLASNYAVVAQEPDFPEQFTAGKAKFAEVEAALRTWEHYEDMNGMYNADYLAATFDDGIEYMAGGECVHWVMLTQVVPRVNNLYPEETKNIGVFAVPADDAKYTGLTVWEPNSYYFDKDSENIDAIIEFAKYSTSPEYYDIVINTDGAARGPAVVAGITLPDVVPEAIRVDMQKYFDEGKTLPALEFLTPVKGANCEQITVELTSGQTTGAQAAQKYDEDCYKSAVQQGLAW